MKDLYMIFDSVNDNDLLIIILIYLNGVLNAIVPLPKTFHIWNGYRNGYRTKAVF